MATIDWGRVRFMHNPKCKLLNICRLHPRFCFFSLVWGNVSSSVFMFSDSPGCTCCVVVVTSDVVWVLFSHQCPPLTTSYWWQKPKKYLHVVHHTVHLEFSFHRVRTRSCLSFDCFVNFERHHLSPPPTDGKNQRSVCMWPTTRCIQSFLLMEYACLSFEFLWIFMRCFTTLKGQNQRSVCMWLTTRCTPTVSPHEVVLSLVCLNGSLCSFLCQYPLCVWPTSSSSPSLLGFSLHLFVYKLCQYSAPFPGKPNCVKLAFSPQLFHFMHLYARCVNILHFLLPKLGVGSANWPKKLSGVPL